PSLLPHPTRPTPPPLTTHPFPTHNPPTPHISPLSLHDALPIYPAQPQLPAHRRRPVHRLVLHPPDQARHHPRTRRDDDAPGQAGDRKSTRLTPVTSLSRMPSSA